MLHKLRTFPSLLCSSFLLHFCGQVLSPLSSSCGIAHVVAIGSQRSQVSLPQCVYAEVASAIADAPSLIEVLKKLDESGAPYFAKLVNSTALLSALVSVSPILNIVSYTLTMCVVWVMWNLIAISQYSMSVCQEILGTFTSSTSWLAGEDCALITSIITRTEWPLKGERTKGTRGGVKARSVCTGWANFLADQGCRQSDGQHIQGRPSREWPQSSFYISPRGCQWRRRHSRSPWRPSPRTSSRNSSCRSTDPNHATSIPQNTPKSHMKKHKSARMVRYSTWFGVPFLT